MISRLTRIFRGRNEDPDCKEVRDLSSEYIDGELDPITADKVKGHLDWCGPCNAFVSTLRATIDLLRSTPKREAPGGFRQRVRESIAKEPRR